jgi:starch synthase
LVFFTGLTPWVNCRAERPRIAWTDCSFSEYISVYHNKNHFCSRDLKRIESAEADFANSCERVLITSDWAREKALKNWQSNKKKIFNIGIFGNENGDISIENNLSKYLLFSSTNFRAKGGYVVLEVFARLRLQHPELELVIIGDAPRLSKSAGLGIRCLGYLSKSVPVQHETYKRALSGAFCLILPTKSDMAPLTLLEAASFGTPTVAFASFAIPELVINGVSGILLPALSSVEEITVAVTQLLHNRSKYEQMRLEARRKFLECFSKVEFQRRVIRQIQGVYSSDM